ncbi:DUF3106 domain-containing protein [Variovorax rhizosphaerae]|uniref:DUF3106 domain-containing protein n=1 Tax=Variovorax rhizosphaerae TaxID=1836200 RepID=A0ABU8WQF1_9BURK
MLQATPAGAQPGAPAGTSEANGKSPVASKPLWTSLTPGQQAALKPLAPHWNTISGVQKSKWLAISRNFDSMKPEDQATLHSRMSEWATLSAQQRALARLNFAEVNRLPADERKAKWEAYQALSEDEKRDWAERAQMRQPSAAIPVRPVPERKLAPVPPTTSLLGKGEHSPRIQLAPPPAPATPSAPPAPVVAAPAPAATADTPVPPAAEAQTPAPGAASAPAAPATIPPVRTTEQPSSAP